VRRGRLPAARQGAGNPPLRPRHLPAAPRPRLHVRRDRRRRVLRQRRHQGGPRRGPRDLTARVDLLAAEDWIRAAVRLEGPVELVRARPWATIARAPAQGGVIWFKACGPVQGFEPRLTAELSARWPDR